MRIKRREPKKEGDTRVKTRFLILPLTLEDETRWLETATYTEELRRGYVEEGIYGLDWVPVYWETPKCSHGFENWDDCPDCRH